MRLLLVIGLSLSLAFATRADEPVRPNVVLIHVDDLGWTDLGCYGSDFYQTPHVDRLAEQGLRFTNAYAACAVCSPSRAALLTGRYPPRLGITDWIRARFQGGAMPADGKNPRGLTTVGDRPLRVAKNGLWLELSEITIAEQLHRVGYATCHIGKWHLGMDPWYPQHQGFDRNVGGCDYGQPPSYVDPYANRRLPEGIPFLPPRRKGEYLTDREADEAVRFIREEAERPFFLYLANYAVHTPIQGRADLVQKYKTRTAGEHHKNAQYAAMVESVDQCVGRVVQVLEELALADRTVVIFTSDNGGLLPITDNWPLKLGKGFPEEGGIRVPLIVRWPGRISAGVTDQPVIGVDHFPTICDLAGVPLPKDRPIDGVSLKALLLDGQPLPADRPLFWHFPHYRGQLGPYSIIRRGRWKLIRRYEGPTTELYDLANDPSETTNLATVQTARRAELGQALDRWLERVGAIIPQPRS